MINTANISSYGSNLYENFYQLVRKTGITEQICDVVKGIFNYCNRHQNALQAFTWYCLFIEAGSLTFETTHDNLDTCQDLVCHLWNTTNETRHLFSPHIEFRCNPSNPNYQPFYFVKECLSKLCEYAKQVNLNFAACVSYNNSVSKEDSKPSLDLTYELWDKLCPKKHFRHPNLIKEATYINSCIASLCNYLNTFEVTVESELSDMCKHANTLKLNELLDRLSKLIHNSEKKLEEDDGWTRANTVTSIIASVATIAVSTIATITTVITYRLTRPTNVVPTDTPSVINGLRGIMRGVFETTRALGNIELRTGHLATENIAMNNLISEVRSLVSEVTEVVEHSFSYNTGNMEIESQAGAQIVTGAFGGVGLGAGIIGTGGTGGTRGSEISRTFLETGKTFQVIRNISDFGQESTLPQFTDQINSVLLDKINSSFPYHQNSINDTKTFIQQFVDDLMFYTVEGYDIATIQADRLRQSFQTWQNAFCYYYKELFCRFPLVRHNDETSILIPDHHMDFIISKQLRALCYLLLDDLWCNWTKFLEILSVTNSYSPVDTKCSWDRLTLKLYQDLQNVNQYEVTTIGLCYNQTLLVKV